MTIFYREFTNWLYFCDWPCVVPTPSRVVVPVPLLPLQDHQKAPLSRLVLDSTALLHIATSHSHILDKRRDKHVVCSPIVAKDW